ncbi:MAG: hypothetical protein AB7S95_15080, partial [Mycolicibacterium sp.]
MERELGGEEPGAVDHRPRRRSVRTLVTSAVMVLTLLASAGLASWLYLFQYRPDQQTDPAAAAVALDAATTGTVALL